MTKMELWTINYSKTALFVLTVSCKGKYHYIVGFPVVICSVYDRSGRLATGDQII